MGNEDTDAAHRAAQELRVWHAAGAFVASFRWQGYLILTFAHPAAPETIQRKVEGWFARLQQHVPRVFCYYSADRGRVTDHWNVHALLGGFFEGPPPPPPYYALGVTHALDWADRLWTRGQVAKSARYDPRGGIVRYMTQPATWAEGALPGTMLGQPLRKSHART